ncbi:hypothetical protein BCL69_107517 [Nitrosomonas communis]|uniref:Transposase of IS4/5 family n=1 Tax=Nitrosomonas communis TaxID=44574 RepID=A0A5D3YC69_9PROT|nr:hypothetical protein BCL69_107517 [Nitrosomonas communis]
MLRLILTDKFWSKLEKFLFPETIDNKRNLRMTVEGILYQCGLAVRDAIYPRRSAAEIPSIKDSMHGH